MNEPPNRKAFLLRLDPAVAAAIETMAAQELRSVNGQIEWLLREALAKRGIALAPGQRIEMRPRAGEHLMLTELKRPLKEGERFPLTLEFERGGKVDVNVYVQTPRDRGGSAPQHQNHQH